MSSTSDNLTNGYTTYASQTVPSIVSKPAMTPAPVVHMGMNGAGMGGALSGPMTNEECGIREVWAHNLETEFRTICQVVQKFNFVAMDTEFPGVVARPIGEFKSTADYQYQLLRCNVDLLKIIQLGLTFLDDKGKLPESGPTTWQFNFKFNLTEDMYAEDSVDLLQNSGIQFEKHEQEGIDPIGNFCTICFFDFYSDGVVYDVIGQVAKQFVNFVCLPYFQVYSFYFFCFSLC